MKFPDYLAEHHGLLESMQNSVNEVEELQVRLVKYKTICSQQLIAGKSSDRFGGRGPTSVGT